jgi:hypothetical protein
MPDSTAQPRSVKTTVDLPVDVWRAAKIRAMDDQTDLRSIVIAALRDYLDLKEAEPGVRTRRK